jgi:hypothetical protein
MQAALFPSTSNPVRHEGTFAYELDAFVRSLAGQAIVSTSRCIDGLLDLYNVTVDPAARRLIEAALREVRFTNAVRSEQVLRALIEIDEAALVDQALGET